MKTGSASRVTNAQRGILVDQGQKFLALGQKDLEGGQLFHRIGLDAESLVTIMEFWNPVSDLLRINGGLRMLHANAKGPCEFAGDQIVARWIGQVW